MIPSYPKIHKFDTSLICNSLNIFFHKIIFSECKPLIRLTYNFFGKLVNNTKIYEKIDLCTSISIYKPPRSTIIQKIGKKLNEILLRNKDDYNPTKKIQTSKIDSENELLMQKACTDIIFGLS